VSTARRRRRRRRRRRNCRHVGWAVARRCEHQRRGLQHAVKRACCLLTSSPSFSSPSFSSPLFFSPSFFSPSFSSPANSTYHIYSCRFDIVNLRVTIVNNAQNVCRQRRHMLTDDVSTRRWRGSQRPLPGARSMDLVDRNRFRKSSTPRLFHFLFETSLINRVSPYFFDSQTFLSISCFLLLTF